MPLDADIAGFLAGNATALAFPPGARTDPELARRYLDEVRPRLNTAPTVVEPVFDVHDETVDGGPAARIYRSEPTPGHPVIVYLHGGGWVSGGLEMNDGWCRRMALATGAVLVSVEYRLAPESPYPAASDDAMAALAWAGEHAARLGGDPDRIAIAGTSAGGNLAAGVCLRARDLGVRAPGLQVLLYPVTDLPQDNRSYLDNAHGYLLERDQMEWYWDCYLPGRADVPDALPVYAAPGRAEDLAGLPPAVVVTAEYDPLRDEAETYAARLQESGVEVEHLRIDGMIHGFLSFLDVMPSAAAAAGRITDTVRAALETHCPVPLT
jgi:acetyl esterase